MASSPPSGHELEGLVHQLCLAARQSWATQTEPERRSALLAIDTVVTELRRSQP